MFLGSNTDKHPQGSTAGVATIHHCDVQQIPLRGSTSIFPEVCDPFTNCQEVRAGGWRRSELSTDIQLDIHVKAYRENGVSAAHSLPRKAQHASETSIWLPRSSFNGNSRSQGHLRHPRCCWPGQRGLARSSQHVGRVRLGWSWYLAVAAGDLFRDGRHGSGMATIIPHWPITTGFLQRWSFLNRLDHYRCTAQGSVLGPLLFLLYSADVPLIASQHGLDIHCYADDGQIYIFDKAAAAVGMVNKVASCIEEIDRWMSSSRLKLNSEKTQFIWLGSRQQFSKAGVDHVKLGNYAVTPQSTVCNLGVHLDSQLTMKVHVQHYSISSSSSSPCDARSLLMHVQPLYMHLLPAGLTTVTACWLESEMVWSINCRLCCKWRPAWSSVNASSIQSRLTFVTVSIGFSSVQESTSSWVSSFTSVSMAPLLHTSRRCLCRNQLFQASPVFARWREVTLCREQKQKQLGHEASPLLGPPSGTIYLTIWGTLP